LEAAERSTQVAMHQATAEREPAQPVGPRRRPGRAALAAFAFASALAYVAVGVVEGSGVPLVATKPTLLGVAVGHDADALAKARAAMRAYLDVPLVLELGDRRRAMPRSAFAQIDEVRLSSLIREAQDPSSPLMRNAPNGQLALPLPIVVDPKRALATVVALKDDFDVPADDAKLDLENRKLVAEANGLRVDAYATIAAIESAIRGAKPSVTIASVPVSPAVKASALAGVEMSDTIGYFETKYATDAKHADRTFNLRLAASKLNGKVILPGETFDFNAVVGPRDEAHGYRIAKVISDGELVDGIGGGTCQIAGTLHGASVFAGLEVVQRTPHTRPSFYIKMGLDAAVAYPSVNLKLRNPFPFPVVLKETVQGGVVRAEILGPKRTRVVTFVRKIEEILPFPEREIRDDRLAAGARVVTQRGIPGFKVRRYRIVRDGAIAVREHSSDVYPPTTQIVRVGAGASGNAGRPAEDEHPEYVVDEYLTITQGPGVGHGASDELRGVQSVGMEESRVPGRTSVRGWTRAYGAKAGPSSVEPGRDDEDAVDDEASAKVAHKRPAGKRKK
jgi:vancomycin resistance protein YoaR